MSLLVAAKFDVNLCILIGIYLQYLMLEGILHFDAWHFISMGMDVVVSVSYSVVLTKMTDTSCIIYSGLFIQYNQMYFSILQPPDYQQCD